MRTSLGFQSASAVQRDQYLSKVISGEYVGAMGMTEPAAGTDVLGMLTTATKKVLHTRSM
jgi:isovaleryl-CoA dehydrogenase